jgi:hypothetical protein
MVSTAKSAYENELSKPNYDMSFTWWEKIFLTKNSFELSAPNVPKSQRIQSTKQDNVTTNCQSMETRRAECNFEQQKKKK